MSLDDRIVSLLRRSGPLMSMGITQELFDRSEWVGRALELNRALQRLRIGGVIEHVRLVGGWRIKT